MATLIKFGQVVLPQRFNKQNDYSAMYPDLAALNVGDTFQATFAGRYSARLARHALAHHARHNLKFEITVRQQNKLLEIKRTA
jgi:hypothetical protein